MAKGSADVADDPDPHVDDVPFDWDGADTLIARFEATATAIEAQRSARAEATEAALLDGAGPHADEIRERQRTADADAVKLTGELRRAADEVRALQQAAREEQDRRDKLRGPPG